MWSETIVRYSLIALVAGLIAFVATPLTLMAARRLRLVDKPGPHKFHIAPVPVLGGIAIWAAIIGSLLIFGGGREYRELAVIMIGGTLIAIVGLVDDRVDLGPRGKIFGQIIAMLVVAIGGVSVNIFDTEWLNIGLTVLWGVCVINAINLQDNMDGLAAGTSAVAAAAFLLLAVLNGQILVASLASALLGACLGFLFYNYQPAVSFMGDTGSMLLGITLAVLGIKLTFPDISHSQTWMVPVLVLGVPLFDTVLVVVSRVRRGKLWWQGGVDHTSHRLVKLGLSHRRTIVALYIATGILGLMSAVIVYIASPMVSWILAGATVLLSIVMIYALELLWDSVRENRLDADIKVTAIGGGEEFLSILEAVTILARTVSVILTPVTKDNRAVSTDPKWNEVGIRRLQDYAICIAEHPGSVRSILNSNKTEFTDSLRERAALMNAALRLRGEILVNLPGLVGDNKSAAASIEVLSDIRETELVVIGGNLHENIIPTLVLPEVYRALTRAKCPRVLIHSDPEKALETLQAVGITDVVTHAIAPQDMHGPWHAVKDLHDSRQIAAVLHSIWLNRNRINILPHPLGVGIHG